MMRYAVAGLLLVCVATACQVGSEQGPSGPTREEIAAEVLSAMDLSADPCEDFYRYACGGWLDSTERPADQASWTRSFNVVIERNREVVREILEEAGADPGDDPDRQRIGHYYASCMDEAAVEVAGTEPLAPIFDLIATVEDAESLMAVAGKLHRSGIGVLFGAQVVPDFKNPDLNISFFVQGGLGMPDRDYYVSDDEKKQELLEEYERHVTSMFGLLGEDEETAKQHAVEVLAVETELARASRDRTAMRQIERLYNKMDIAGLKQLTPELPWDTFLQATGYPDVKDISVATPEFFEAMEDLVAKTEPGVFQTYLRWHAVDGMASLLPQAFVDTDFEFYGKKLAGQQEIKPRWKRCVSATQGAMGEAVGKLYVERMFAGSSKEIALEMIGDIKASFQTSLPGLPWMDETTRGRAVEKLDAMGFKIGYPDEWRDYSAMTIVPGDYFANAMAAIEFEFDRQARKIGNPVDRKEWEMPPQAVNAYNHPLLNEMAYPAGILQPPFFHKDFPAAMNYGAIGGGIGHELTHGFDDQGRKFDPQGRLNEWWEPEVAEKFETAAQCVDDFYSNYEVAGATVNGRLTLGENLADIGGLKTSHAAYKLWEDRRGAPEPLLDELTNEQLLFVSWGQIWCTQMSEEQARMQVTTDPHTPAQFRVKGPMSHIPAFAQAFGCEEGERQNPTEKCLVW
jgi:predicted metalloendopeptidase